MHRHESKCANIHGHNYIAFITARGQLDPLGRVIDFSVLKERVGGWIDDCWDHGFIAYGKDEEAVAAVQMITEQKLFLLPDNPTAENMARHLLEVVGPEVLAGTGVEICKVQLWETENCYAEAVLAD